VAVGPRLVRTPVVGVWRVGWATDPLHAPRPRGLDLRDNDAGNRYDPIIPDFDVLYFGSTRATCYAETLAHRRPDPDLARLIYENRDWVPYMTPGTVEAEWRRRRVLNRVVPEQDVERYLDVANHRSMAWLNVELKPLMVTLGLKKITLAELTTGDRKVTRYISTWLHAQKDAYDQPIFHGIRYPSRYGDDLECWAIFTDRVALRSVETRTIETTDSDLQYVANLFGLTIF
jgi:hypothetical protein